MLMEQRLNRDIARTSFLLIILSLLPSIAIGDVTTQQSSIEIAKTHYFNSQYDKAIELLLPVADNENDPEAQYYAGLIYGITNWKKYNINESIKYLLSSADQNFAPAMWKMGDIYENGLTGQKNLIIATDWYRKSKQAEKRQNNILFYKQDPNGKSAHIQNDTVISSLTVKAGQGNVDAQLKLARIYDDGILTEQDEYKAFEWYLKAAKNNDKYAQFMVGYFICRKIGTEFDLKKSNMWLKKSGRDGYCAETISKEK